jgi:replicative DNA helicase
MTETEERIKKLLNITGNGHKTGYKIKGNEITFKPGALTFVAAPTKHGKTTLLINFFLAMLEKYPDKIHYFFSYEEAEQSIYPKMLSCYFDFIFNKNKDKHNEFIKDLIRNNTKIDELEIIESAKEKIKEKYKNFWENIEKHNISFESFDLIKFINNIEKISKEQNIGVIFVDYLQMVPVESKGSRYEDIKEICNQLKDIAVKNNLSIVIATQFNRYVLNPDDMIPQKLSEGSDVEKSANQIIALWNFKERQIFGTKKNESENKYKDHESTGASGQNKILIKIIANRDGESGIEDIFEIDNSKKIKKIINYGF